MNEGTSTGESPLRLSNIGKTILAGASAALVLRASGAGLKYLMEILFARWLGAEHYGAFAYAYNWAQLLSVLAGLGLVTTVLRYVPEYRTEQAWAKLRGLVVQSQLLTVAAGTALFGLGALVLWMVPYEHWWTLLLGLACLVPMALINVQSSLMRGLKKITAAFFGRYILWPVGSITVVYGLLRVSETPSGRLATGGVAVALSVIALGQMGLVRRVFPADVWSAPADVSATRQWLLVSMPLLLMSGFQIVLNRADVLMVGSLLGATEAGLYNAAARTGGIIAFLQSAFNVIAAPMISERWADRNREGLETLVATIIQWVFWPSLILALALFSFSQPILRLFGGAFDVAWPVLILIGVGQLVNAMTGPVGYLLGLTGHERASAWVYGASAGLNLVLNLVLIPVLGLIGGAVATMLSVTLKNISLVILIRDRIEISIFSLWRRSIPL